MSAPRASFLVIPQKFALKNGWLLIARIHWFLLASHYYKKINQHRLNHWFFRVSSLPEKKFYQHIFFEGKANFLQVLDFLLRIQKNYKQWMNLTDRPGNHTQVYDFRMFSGFWEWQNSNPGSDQSKIFIDHGPFTLHMLVGLMHNITTAK